MNLIFSLVCLTFVIIFTSLCCGRPMLVAIDLIKLSKSILSNCARPVIMRAANVLLALRIAKLFKFLSEALLGRIIRFITELIYVSSLVVAWCGAVKEILVKLSSCWIFEARHSRAPVLHLSWNGRACPVRSLSRSMILLLGKGCWLVLETLGSRVLWQLLIEPVLELWAIIERAILLALSGGIFRDISTLVRVAHWLKYSSLIWVLVEILRCALRSVDELFVVARISSVLAGACQLRDGVYVDGWLLLPLIERLP